MTRRPPPVLVALATVGVLLVVVPLVGLALSVPWGDLLDLLSAPTVRSALWLSLVASVSAMTISVLLGVPTAWVLARRDFPGRAVVRGLVLLPVVLPPVVGGASLLFALGRSGVFGAPLHDLTGLVLPFSFAGVVAAVTFVSFPFVVLTMEGAFRAVPDGFEGAAATLGASPWRVFRRITLPLVRPSIAAASLLAWARAFGEFGATITFAGNLPGRTQTLPLAVFVALETDRDAAIAISLVMVVVSLVVLVALRDRWWRA